MPSPVALVDCNNLYASCERVFQTELRGVLNGTLGAEALKCTSPSALREWLVSRRVNKAGEGDDDQALIEPLAASQSNQIPHDR